jgi:ribosomal-protein-serine acetyltransferase
VIQSIRFTLSPEAELRLLDVGDAEALFALVDRNRAHLRQWLPWVDYTRTIEDSRMFRLEGLERFAENGSFEAGIWYKGELAGVIGLHRIAWAERKTSIGYWLGEEFQGKGLMTMACRAVIRHAFEDMDLNRIEIKVAIGNFRSRAIPQRLGFTHEGVLRDDGWLYDHHVDHDVFSLLRREWLTRDITD